MGSPESENWRIEDETQHEVTVSSFYMDPFETTQTEYVRLMGENTSAFDGEDLPVENISWLDAVRYANAKSEDAGLVPAYTITGEGVTWDRSADGYRLPTEAEWEYACRAGTTTALNSGKNLSNSSQCSEVEEVAWYFFSGAGMTSVVGQKQPNAWGLYDMHGNVKEWCLDWYNENYYQSSPSEDPTGPAAPIDYDYNNYKVVRGGGWATYAYDCRSASRGKYYEDRYDRYTGFRVALAPVK